VTGRLGSRGIRSPWLQALAPLGSTVDEGNQDDEDPEDKNLQQNRISEDPGSALRVAVGTTLCPVARGHRTSYGQSAADQQEGRFNSLSPDASRRTGTVALSGRTKLEPSHLQDRF
jgi:hypothetical protein